MQKRLVIRHEKPATNAGRMGQRQEKRFSAFLIGANDLFQACFATKGLDGHAADQQHNSGPEDAQFSVEVGAAEREFGRCRATITVSPGITSRIAACQRTKICVSMQVAGRKAGLLQPLLPDTAARTAERATFGYRTMPRSLPNDHYAIVEASAHQRRGHRDIPPLLAQAAG